MDMNKKSQADEETMKEKRLAGWVRLTAVLFRVLIMLGLVSLAILIILLIFTNIFVIWILAIPLALILIGIGLARLEFTLHDRLYAAGHKKTNQIDKEK